MSFGIAEIVGCFLVLAGCCVLVGAASMVAAALGVAVAGGLLVLGGVLVVYVASALERRGKRATP